LLELNIQLVSLGFLGIHQLPIKKWIFLIEGVFFLLTSPLMGDPYVFHPYVFHGWKLLEDD